MTLFHLQIQTTLTSHVEQKSTKASSDQSIGSQHAPAPTSLQFSHSSHPTPTLQPINTTKPPSTASNTCTVLANTGSPFILTAHLLSKRTTTFRITTTKKHTTTLLLPLHPNVNHSQLSATPVGAANLAALSLMELPSKCSSSDHSPDISSAAVAAPSPGSPSARHKQPRAPVRPKSWQLTNASKNSSLFASDVPTWV